MAEETRHAADLDSTREDTPLIVTSSFATTVDLESRGITRKQAVELRERLAAFAAEWDSPEMDIYDRYPVA